MNDRQIGHGIYRTKTLTTERKSVSVVISNVTLTTFEVLGWWLDFRSTLWAAMPVYVVQELCVCTVWWCCIGMVTMYVVRSALISYCGIFGRHNVCGDSFRWSANTKGKQHRVETHVWLPEEEIHDGKSSMFSPLIYYRSLSRALNQTRIQYILKKMCDYSVDSWVEHPEISFGLH